LVLLLDDGARDLECVEGIPCGSLVDAHEDPPRNRAAEAVLQELVRRREAQRADRQMVDVCEDGFEACGRRAGSLRNDERDANLDHPSQREVECAS
jgi:hypothetical protein